MMGLMDAIKVGAGAILGAALISGPIYLYGKTAGKTEAAVAALELSVKALRERSATDDEISRSDLAGCAVISGCSQTTNSNACDGFKKLNMRLETALFVTMNDRQFANGVAGHNAHGVKQRCWD